MGYKNGKSLFYWGFADLAELTVLSAHSIFVIKYYIISLSISEQMQNKEDKYIAVKVYSVSIVQAIFIVLTFIYVPTTNKGLKYFEEFYCALPAYFIVVILAIAFIKLRSSGGIEYSLSMF